MLLMLLFDFFANKYTGAFSLIKAEQNQLHKRDDTSSNKQS
uniref:Uncharacterized protein n=1 Tax=Amphimedon queenslandica TaxID=400682 RepID=A0A1X7V4A1_AMPQE